MRKREPTAISGAGWSASALCREIDGLPEGERLAHVYQRAENDEAPCGQRAHQCYLAIRLIGMIRGEMADPVGQEQQAENWEHHGSQRAPGTSVPRQMCSHFAASLL